MLMFIQSYSLSRPDNAHDLIGFALRLWGCRCLQIVHCITAIGAWLLYKSLAAYKTAMADG